LLATPTGQPVATDRTEHDFHIRAEPPYFDGIEMKPGSVRDIVDARILHVSRLITTPHFLRYPSRRHLQRFLLRTSSPTSGFNQYGTVEHEHDAYLRHPHQEPDGAHDLGVVGGGLTKYPDQQRLVYDVAMHATACW
jgi:hypothetical protein